MVQNDLGVKTIYFVVTKRERALLGLQSIASNICRGLIQRPLDMAIIEPKHENCPVTTAMAARTISISSRVNTIGALTRQGKVSKLTGLGYSSAAISKMALPN